MSEQEEYMEIQDKLKNLPQIKAKGNFENMLMQKINLSDAEMQDISEKQSYTQPEKKSIFEKIFVRKTNYWLIPALGSAVAIIIIFSIYNPFKKTEISPVTPVIQSLTDSSANKLSGSRQETPEINKSENKNFTDKDIASELSTGKTEDSRLSAKDKIKTDDGIIAPEPVTPKLETKKEEGVYKKAFETEKVKEPPVMEQQHIDIKTVDETKSEGPVTQPSQVEEKKVSKSDPANKNEEGKTGKIKGDTERKVGEKKTKRAVTDSTDILKKELEKNKDSILEKEKNK